jgi:hypothetical protein
MPYLPTRCDQLAGERPRAGDEQINDEGPERMSPGPSCIQLGSAPFRRVFARPKLIDSAVRG